MTQLIFPSTQQNLSAIVVLSFSRLFFRERHCIDYIKILSICLCINDVYIEIVWDKLDFQQVIRHPLSIPKKNSTRLSVISSITALQIEKNKQLIKLEGIAYTMTPNCERKLKWKKKKWLNFEKKFKISLEKRIVSDMAKLNFLFNRETRGSLYVETISRY